MKTAHWLVLLPVLLLGWHTAAVAAPGGLFAVYDANRNQGIPNYITADLVLLSYSLIRDNSLAQTEEKTLLPQLQALVQGLREQTQANDAIGQANQDYLAVLEALLEGSGQPVKPADPKRAAAELQQVLAAKGPAPSPLWGMVMDYSQFQPRGHYTRSPALERYFRAYRYANTVLFAVQDSAATGVSRDLADRATGQALRLAQAIQEPALQARYEALDTALTWTFGPPDDLTSADLLAAAKNPPDIPALRQALLKLARDQDRQPRILGGIVDKTKLEANLTPRDVLTGWRLLPSRYSPDAAVFQNLVYDRVGVYQDDCPNCPPPFTLALIDNKKVKGFPSAYELMALLGSDLARQCLDQQHDTRYEGYAAAVQAAERELDRAEGMSADELQLIRDGLGERGTDLDSSQRLTTILGFWTWQRYLSVLYSKQSYTVSGKSLAIPKERTSAGLEPAPGIYLALDRLVAKQQLHMPYPVWERFAKVLDRLIAISKRERRGTTLSADDVAFLNELDRILLSLTGGPDTPIVIDVHTNPASSEVLEQGIGYAQVVQKPLANGQTAQGARFTHYEFKQPLSERLTDEAWRKRLAALTAEGGALPGRHSCPSAVAQKDVPTPATAVVSPQPAQPVPAAATPALPGASLPPLAPPPKAPQLEPRIEAEKKLDGALLGLVHARADGGEQGLLDYAKGKGLTLTGNKVKVEIVATTTDTAALKQRIAALGGTLITELDKHLFALLPVAAIGEFAALNEVWSLAVPQQLTGPPAEPLPGSGDTPPVVPVRPR